MRRKPPARGKIVGANARRLSSMPPEHRCTVPPLSGTYARYASRFPKPLDSAKVERLRAALEDGSLEVDALLIAERIIEDEG